MTSTGTHEDTPGPLDASQQATERLPQPAQGDPPRPGRSRGLLVVLVLLLLMPVALFGAVIAVRTWLPDLPELRNPFAGEAETVDRTQPAVLEAIEGISEYRAATGHLQVIVDLEQDYPNLPAFLRGERTLFVAVGSVDARVDFSEVGEGSVQVSEDRESVSLRLPHAELADATVDPERSYVFDRRRGLLDRLGGVFEQNPTSERELYLLAEQRMEEAAAETDLLDTAERNTAEMLDSLLRSLGFTEVDITFG